MMATRGIRPRTMYTLLDHDALTRQYWSGLRGHWLTSSRCWPHQHRCSLAPTDPISHTPALVGACPGAFLRRACDLQRTLGIPSDCRESLKLSH